ncbi:MAG: hypothetical protein UT34_C0001G0392 [candidate division WS6 bacterium GW2011_GWF2_39_15]|uniref:Uncharacterized protein n=1 Tax=candidate division WS6 bacterium GW2011_GWF2_39_15 TaxID=1619100 RepID=A0A0G0QXJ6_9BACT|nr:MAG: hypothetical protein UT34_C0001G0392 [candidate division WS6 bacterium GW2011_GWF2_39_15]
MRKINKEYRKVNEPTDVLSFNIDETINEIYICPSYIYKRYRGRNFIIEVYRMIIHGLLHIYGFDHKGKFDKLEKDSEEMFQLQETILNKAMNK